MSRARVCQQKERVGWVLEKRGAPTANMMSSPPQKVLQAFGVSGRIQKLGGGQGHAFASDSVVLKPVADEAEANWIAETHLGTEQRGFRLARPIASSTGAFLVDGWTAWSRLPGEHRLQGAPWPYVVTLCARFHAALKGVPRPSILERRQDNFSQADRQIGSASCRERV